MIDFTVFLIIIYLVLESFEIFTQKASTLMGMLAKLYAAYKKSILHFILAHPTYLFSLYLLVYTNFTMEAIFFVGLKSLDIGMKVKMLQQIFEKKEISHELTLMLLQKINPMLYLINFLVYAPLVILALFPYEF